MSNWKQRRDSQLAAIEWLRSQTPKYPERIGGVYVIRVGDRVKIGRSVNPEQRIAAMQLPQRPEVVLIVQCKGWRALESSLHKHFADHRKHGEWFDLSEPQLTEAIKICREWEKAVRG